VVIVLVVVNLPGASVGDEEWIPSERSVVSGRVDGDPSAPVRIIEFSDFQCPFCKRFTDDTAPQILAEFVETGIASLEYRHFSFLGPESFAAAEAAECARDQDRFWDYHDLLFLRQGAENRGVFSNGNLKDFARELQEVYSDFDLDAFDQCLDSGRMESVVEEMTNEASTLGVRSTPSFLINGQLISGALDFETFKTAIETAADAS
jgi:protein-disulfide isomerase